VVEKCKEWLQLWLKSKSQKASSIQPFCFVKSTARELQMLQVITVAHRLSFQELLDDAIDNLSRYPHTDYMGKSSSSTTSGSASAFSSGSVNISQDQKLYDALPVQIQHKIVQKRLERYTQRYRDLDF